MKIELKNLFINILQ